jgi:hypothetical protein
LEVATVFEEGKSGGVMHALQIVHATWVVRLVARPKFCATLER